jgi:hypothetical protein
MNRNVVQRARRLRSRCIGGCKAPNPITNQLINSPPNEHRFLDIYARLFVLGSRYHTTAYLKHVSVLIVQQLRTLYTVECSSSENGEKHKSKFPALNVRPSL